MKTRLLALFPSLRWQDFIGLAISAGFLYATLVQTSDSFWLTGLSTRQWLLSIAASFCTVAVIVVQGYRMRWFLAPAPWRIEQISGFPSVNIGNLYNAVLPGNIGEFIKTHHFARKNRIPFRTAMACWVGEKFFDGLQTAFICLLMLVFPPLFVSNLKWVFFIPIVGAILCVGVILMSYKRPKMLTMFFRFIPHKQVAITLYKTFLGFRNQLCDKKGRFRLYAFVLGALIMGVLNISGFTFNMLAGNIPEALLTIDTVLVICVLMALVYFVPSAPSSIGVLHYGVYTSLTLMAGIKGILLTPEVKDSFVLTAFLIHATYSIPEIVLGAVYLIKERRLVFTIRQESTNETYR